MKVLVDLDRALADGNITQEEHRRIGALASSHGSDLALNILMGFGVTAVAAGFLALVPSTATAAVTGSVLGLLGLALILLRPERWRILGEILLVVGTALLAGAVILLDQGSARSAVGVALLFTAVAIVARNGLFAALAVLALSAAIGARTGYVHAMYMIGVKEPLTTVMTFTALAIGLVAVSERVPHRLSRLAIIAARTSVLLVNLGFWVGSLWGDRTGHVPLSREAFVGLWALALLAAAVWAWHANRRWPLITATVFAAIHFYTQWFERLGAKPGAVLAAGLIMVVIGLGLKTLLTRMPAQTAA